MTRSRKYMEVPQPPRALVPRGPEVLGLGMNIEQQGRGPGEPPADFVGGSTSRTEWYIYWALTILAKAWGFEWEYQASYLGGRQQPGGAVVDFIVYLGTRRIGLRIQTFYFHLAFGPEKQSYDVEQKVSLSSADIDVIDIYEQSFIHDDTGESVLRVVRMALQGDEEQNPLATGMALDMGK